MNNISEEELRQKLTPEQYHVLREKGTEAPFSGKFLNHNQKGVYSCMVCGTELFKSDSKFDSTTPGLAGWPSFSDVINAGKVKLVDDDSLGMHRTEVVCATCGSHLGHLFDDLPASRPGMYFTYAILCDNDDIYIGQTHNLQQRWKQHCNGTGADHTKKHKPKSIVHYEVYNSQEKAVQREKWLKTGFGRKWLRREWKAGRTRQAGDQSKTGKHYCINSCTLDFKDGAK